MTSQQCAPPPKKRPKSEGVCSSKLGDNHKRTGLGMMETDSEPAGFQAGMSPESTHDLHQSVFAPSSWSGTEAMDICDQAVAKHQ